MHACSTVVATYALYTGDKTHILCYHLCTHMQIHKMEYMYVRTAVTRARTHARAPCTHTLPRHQVFEELERALCCDPTLDKRLCHDGQHHFLLPAFFHTLSALRDAGRSYSLVIRTFGTDGVQVVEAINAFAEGAHPTCAAVPELGESLRGSPLWKGTYQQGDGEAARLELAGSGGESVNSELQIEETLVKPHARISAVCCQDDYEWWRDHQYDPATGKPLWVTVEDAATHPIFFDDNIHNHRRDSIVAVRVRRNASTGYAALSGEETVAMQGLVLRRVPTFAPILDKNWFLNQIEVCEKRLAEVRAASPATGTWCPVPP